MSGAALLCGIDGEFLAGVVASDQRGRRHTQLEATPAYVLHHDDAFRAALDRYGGAKARVLEPVQYAGLADPEQTPNGYSAPGSPAGLPHPRREVVPFHGRTGLLDDLRAWATRPGPGVRLVYGPGGQGKTRLARQLAHELAGDRWAVMWLRPDAMMDESRNIPTPAVPLLIVIERCAS
ncbi:ATP-binding protein [Streptomyces adelaidensis]|uniref:ATP-binding protein n=1 Tax=Streptomyces adelaidensis TaxID=2796465 RepID=UPI001903B946|nr:ATP-binding protein [Streptomyces adelaidensis]